MNCNYKQVDHAKNENIFLFLSGGQAPPAAPMPQQMPGNGSQFWISVKK